MFKSLQPSLDASPYVFTLLHQGNVEVLQHAFAQIREKEGTTLILPQAVAEEYHIPFTFIAARITLEVFSELTDVGLTAEVSRVLAEAGISCNVVAGYFHDHLFVPYDQRVQAIACLQDLSKTE